MEFSAQPADHVRKALRAYLGARWSGRRAAWSIQAHVSQAEFDAAIARAERGPISAPPRPAAPIDDDAPLPF